MPLPKLFLLNLFDYITIDSFDLLIRTINTKGKEAVLSKFSAY